MTDHGSFIVRGFKAAWPRGNALKGAGFLCRAEVSARSAPHQ